MTQMLATDPTSIATALLLSDDAATITLLTQCLEELAISTDVCACAGDFDRLLNQKKLEAVIVDLPRTNGLAQYLSSVRSSPSNGSAITFAISGGHDQSFASSERPKFLLESPLSRDAVRRTLRVSFGLIVRERRRYFRCPISIPATLRCDEIGNIDCQVINISEGGMALKNPGKLPLGICAEVGFEVPNQLARQVVKSQVAWCNEGRVGVRFLSQTTTQRVELQGWLAQQLENSFPERVLKTFQSLTGSVTEGNRPALTL